MNDNKQCYIFLSTFKSGRFCIPHALFKAESAQSVFKINIVSRSTSMQTNFNRTYFIHITIINIDIFNSQSKLNWHGDMLKYLHGNHRANWAEPKHTNKYHTSHIYSAQHTIIFDRISWMMPNFFLCVIGMLSVCYGMGFCLLWMPRSMLWLLYIHHTCRLLAYTYEYDIIYS